MHSRHESMQWLYLFLYKTIPYFYSGWKSNVYSLSSEFECVAFSEREIYIKKVKNMEEILKAMVNISCQTGCERAKVEKKEN